VQISEVRHVMRVRWNIKARQEVVVVLRYIRVKVGWAGRVWLRLRLLLVVVGYRLAWIVWC